MTLGSLPVIDISGLIADRGDEAEVAAQIAAACRREGFFYVVGHGVPAKLFERLERLCRIFFSADLATKLAIRMERGGRAWRGYFPLGAELTLGRPDQKEGLYFGAELSDDHPKVEARVPLHGRNLFPQIAGFREAVLETLAALTELGHHLMRGIACSLELDPNYFKQRYTGDPLILFRVFHYPPLPLSSDAAQWSVGEHTDYGLLTILRQDDVGGLQIRSKLGWIDAPPIPGSLVCNIGDMLDRMTGGLYRSTPHRVRNTSRAGRLSFPFFFDPNFDAAVKPIPSAVEVDDDWNDRWDRTSVHDFSGTYGEYILRKISKVFPELGRGT